MAEATNADDYATEIRPKADWLLRLACMFLLVCFLLAVFAHILPLYGYSTMGPARLAAPSSAHLFGTDQFRRDILARVVFGIRTSLWVAAIGVATSTAIGMPMGLMAGLLGGATEAVFMRILDALLAFPALLLAIGISAVLGSGATSAALALGIVGVPQMARIVRGAVLAEKSNQYVDAARAIGVSTGMIMLRHILPNVAAPAIVQAALYFSVAILTEASLSFLGLGVQVPLPSLGSMLYEARQFMSLAPWYAIVPGTAITLLVLAMNMLADALRDRLDPIQ